MIDNAKQPQCVVKSDEAKTSQNSSVSDIKPYLCMDLSQRNKVLISRWSVQAEPSSKVGGDKHELQKHHEEQCVAKEVSQRCLPSPVLGKTLARLHVRDKYLNLMFRQWTPSKMESEFKKHHLSFLCKEKNNIDRTVALANQFGPRLLSDIMNNLKEDYRSSLVGNQDDGAQPGQRRSLLQRLSPTPRGSILESLSPSRSTPSFRSSASSQIVTTLPPPPLSQAPESSPKCARRSWLDSPGPFSLGKSPRCSRSEKNSSPRSGISRRMGQVGRDVGMPLTYPIACIMAYALQGRSSDVQGIIQCFQDFWDSYAAKLTEQGKGEKFVASAYRRGLGWCGWFLYLSCYRMTAYMDVIPVEDLSDEDKEIVLDAIGTVSLKLLRLGFESSHSGFIDDDDSEDGENDFCQGEDNSTSDTKSEKDSKEFEWSSPSSVQQELDDILDAEVSNLSEVALLNRSSFFFAISNAGKARSPTREQTQREREPKGWSIH